MGGERKGLNNSPDLNAKSDGGVEFFAEPKTSRGEQQNVDSVQSIIPAPRALGERRVNPSRRPSLSLSLSFFSLPSCDDPTDEEDDDDANKL